jgi:CTP:molybdopterin cytidylyltransferase MocA
VTQPPTAVGRSAHPVAGVVLAAGAGRRFGRPKALVELDGERLVDRAVRLLQTGGCDPVVVVSGAVSLVVDDALVVENADWQTGMGSSLRRGLAAVPEACEAAVIALVDQPYVGSEAVRRLISANQAGATAAVVTYSGRWRNPVLLARSTWEDVRALAYGDVGARRYLEAHRGDVVEVPGDGTGDPRDIDTPADLPRA